MHAVTEVGIYLLPLSLMQYFTFVALFIQIGQGTEWYINVVFFLEYTVYDGKRSTHSNFS